MNRALHWVNLAGVLALAALCVAQWQHNRRLNLDLVAAENACRQHTEKLADQEKRLTGSTSDLDSFREQLTRAAAARASAETRLTTVERDLKQLQIERDQLRTSVTNWAAAVTARDEQLRKAAAEATRLAAERNDAVTKFNDLAARQNTLVKDLERRLQEHNARVEELNTRTREFNAQVKKFNALQQTAGQATNRPSPPPPPKP